MPYLLIRRTNQEVALRAVSTKGNRMKVFLDFFFFTLPELYTPPLCHCTRSQTSSHLLWHSLWFPQQSSVRRHTHTPLTPTHGDSEKSRLYIRLTSCLTSVLSEHLHSDKSLMYNCFLTTSSIMNQKQKPLLLIPVVFHCSHQLTSTRWCFNTTQTTQ